MVVIVPRCRGRRVETPQMSLVRSMRPAKLVLAQMDTIVAADISAEAGKQRCVSGYRVGDWSQ